MNNQEKTISNIQCGLKTDLDLLLECLKYQMDSPETQKQALVTIYSICQQNCEASDYFREIGGVDFIRGLIKLTNASVLREAALFTLGALAESSVYCQQSLCTLELLSDVAMSLAQKDASLILKRTDVYMILVLVSHNKIGQALARSTGCIDILLNLFRTRFPMSDKQSIHENIGQYYELWSSIGSTLCACVNNPQNEENQRLCTTAFPFANECLQKCIRQEIIRPICAFIGLTVANNSYAQNYFCKVGGLDTLAQTVANLAEECLTNHSNVELIISVIKTLDSCISENSSLASRLSKYSIVPMLVALLSQNNLDTNSKLGVILAIGHCTDGCEAHQYQLLKSNGLPLMIQIVAESQDEEQRKAATFVLQSCQLITEKLSNSLVENSQSKEGIITSNPKDISLRNYWKFAKEFLHKIETLEKHQEEKVKRQIFVEDDIPREEIGENPLTLCSDLIDNEISGSLNYSVHSLNVGQDFRCSGCSNVAASLNSRNFSKILQSCPNKCDRHKVIQECEDRYKKELKKLLNIDITKIDKKLFLTPVKRTTSHITDFHIQQTDSINLAKASTKSFLLTPMKKSASDNITLPRQQSEDTTQFDGTIRQGHVWPAVLLVMKDWKYQPEDRRSLCTPRVYNKTTFQNHIYSFDDGKHSDICKYAVGTRQTRKRRRRKDFTKEEVGYLLDGVLKMGYHWNSILWSYPFQKGRTNVDLAHKYRNLQKRNLNKSISGSQDCSVELC
ncbi:telomere repeats-binding bouquet formation protein 1 [Hypanus sabinus]|uniref:telomere repeats-binding bouquet formation protein 1 n=1 Tax=Hypanus sabinus TaxID=79690 RepID=UPI0028C45558|nr:telomere repeats-binding bouquet formation protein 1 [Hypanus sabinus]